MMRGAVSAAPLTIAPRAPAAFHVMAKPRGPVCNLDCGYCYYLSKEQLYPGSDFRMSDEMLRRHVQQYIEAQRVPEVIFTWQGGEPTLMGLDFFRRVIAYQRQFRRPGMHVVNTLQTNGTLLNEEWCVFFRRHDFLVGISLDGPRHLHDTYRVDKGGHATFDGVMRGIRLLQRHGVEFNVLTTVNAANVGHPLAVYRYLRDDVRAKFIQLIPIVEPIEGGPKVSARSVHGAEYGTFLISIFDEWVKQDVGQIFVQMFDVALAAWVGAPPGLCVFAEACGTALALEHTGDLYSCDHFVEPEHWLGNLAELPMLEMVSSQQQRAFGAAKRDTLPAYCRGCEVRFACNGGCPKDRLLRTPEGEPGLNHLCAGYKAFFRHVDRPMRLMAAELHAGRPASNVMRALRGNRGSGHSSPTG